MTEFELHSLLIASRGAFDHATLMVVLVNFMFLIVALWKSGELPKVSVRRLEIMCIAVSAFFTVRAIAALVRMEEIMRNLGEQDAAMDLVLSVWQWPTLLLAIVTVVICPFVSTYFLNKAERDY